MQAFEGIRVLDLTHVLAGPFSTYQLAVLGADVIKIEAPERGDMNREFGPVPALNEAGMGSHFQSQAANKRAMTLNLKSPQGREIFLSLARGADVIVENYRSGAMARMGLGYDDVRAVNPRIIYCSITGFGQTGPKRGHGAFDHVIQAYSGIMMATGHEDGPPIMVGPPVLDYGTGTHAAFAISAALLRRERTGEGQYLDVAMLDAALMLMSAPVLNVALTGNSPERSAWGRDIFGAYGCFETADDLLVVCVVTPEQHARLWTALDRPDLVEDVRGRKLADMPSRRERDERILTDLLKTRTANTWEALLNEAGVPAARVRALDEALGSDQVASRNVQGHIANGRTDTEGLRPAVAAFTCSEDGPALKSVPPLAGEHTADILRDLGYGDAAVDAFERQGVI
ncbi:MAG: CoA transferase [Pseudomonadota bacterium]